MLKLNVRLNAERLQQCLSPHATPSNCRLRTKPPVRSATATIRQQGTFCSFIPLARNEAFCHPAITAVIIIADENLLSVCKHFMHDSPLERETASPTWIYGVFNFVPLTCLIRNACFLIHKAVKACLCHWKGFLRKGSYSIAVAIPYYAIIIASVLQIK